MNVIDETISQIRAAADDPTVLIETEAALALCAEIERHRLGPAGHIRLAAAYWLCRLAARLLPSGRHELQFGLRNFAAERLAKP